MIFLVVSWSIYALNTIRLSDWNETKHCLGCLISIEPNPFKTNENDFHVSENEKCKQEMADRLCIGSDFKQKNKQKRKEENEP